MSSSSAKSLTKSTPRRTRRSADETRELMLRAGTRLALDRLRDADEDAAARALAHIRLTDVAKVATELERGEGHDRGAITTGAIYQFWSSQAAFQADLMVHVLTEEPLPAEERLAARALELIAAGGPIVSPECNVLTITPICPHALTNRPVVISSTEQIELRLARGSGAGMVQVDGMQISVVESKSVIRIKAFEPEGAFQLVGLARLVPNADKRLKWEGGLVPADGAEFNCEFEGTPEEAGAIKDALAPLFRAAADKELEATFTFTFAEGLALAGGAAEAFADKLAKSSAGLVRVEAEAVARP